MSRSVIPYGLPPPGWKEGDSIDKLMDIYGEKLYQEAGLEKAMMDHLGLEHTENFLGISRSGYRGNDPDHPGSAVKGDLQIMVWNYHLERIELRRTENKDNTYFIFAIGFCFLFTWYYTDSLFV